MEDLFNSTHSKSLSEYFGYAPYSITSGKGVYVFDKAKNRFLDCGMALGSVSLGYAYEEVDDFVITTIRNGVNFSRPSYLEEELTLSIQQQLKTPMLAQFSKSSSMLLNTVPRVCRYLTGKACIAYPLNGAYLGNTDWYLAKTLKAGGIITEVKNKTINFENGNLESVKNLFELYSQELACIIMEPYREEVYDEKFYSELSYLCKKNNVFLIFDETISSFRFHYPLAQRKIKCNPDLTILGKSFSNGYALAAIIGEENLMKEIQTTSSAKDLYGFSNTHSGETVGLAAAIKTLEIFSKKDVVKILNLKGYKLFSMMSDAIKNHSLESVLSLKGQPPYFYVTAPKGRLSNAIREEMIKYFYDAGLLFRGTIAISFSHTDEHLEIIAYTFRKFLSEFKNRYV